MGRHLVPGADNQHQSVGLVAETALSAGDYAKVGVGGYARRATEGVPLATQNSASGVTALVPGALVEAGGGAWGRNSFSAQFFRSVLALDSGYFAVLFTGNGSTADTGVNLRIYNVSVRPTHLPWTSNCKHHRVHVNHRAHHVSRDSRFALQCPTHSPGLQRAIQG